MKQADYARVAAEKLYVQFALSGESGDLTVIELHNTRLSTDDTSLMAVRPGAVPQVIETFANSRTCQEAHRRATRAVRHAIRRRRIVALTRAIALYGVYPLIFVFFALAFNLALHTRQGGNLAAVDVSAPGPTFPPATRGRTETVAASDGKAPAPRGEPSIPSESIAKGLARGAESGKFVVRLGPPAGETRGSPIYVFEDPLCPHCQELAPELAQLAKSRTVYVFPVTVVGGAESRFPAAAALCADDKDRSSVWNRALQGTLVAGPGRPVPTITAACTKAVEANDAIFSEMSLLGTPTVFDGAGRMMPLTLPVTAASVAAWATP